MRYPVPLSMYNRCRFSSIPFVKIILNLIIQELTFSDISLVVLDNLRVPVHSINGVELCLVRQTARLLLLLVSVCKQWDESMPQATKA